MESELGRYLLVVYFCLSEGGTVETLVNRLIVLVAEVLDQFHQILLVKLNARFVADFLELTKLGHALLTILNRRAQRPVNILPLVDQFLRQLFLEATLLEKVAHRVPHLRATRSKVLRIFTVAEHLFGLTRVLVRLRLSWAAIDMTRPLTLTIADDLRDGAESRFVAHQQVGMAQVVMLRHAKARQLLLLVKHFVLPRCFFDGLWLVHWRLRQVRLPRLLLA